MRHARFATCLLLTAALALSWTMSALAQGWGEIRVAERVVNLRQARGAQAPLVRSLQPGEKVKVDFVRPSGWGAVFDVSETERDESRALGFADVRNLAPVDQAAKARPAAAPPKAQAPDAVQIRQVEARTELYKERSLQSPVVAVLAPGEHVQTGYPRDGFLAVFRMNDPAASDASALGFIPTGMAKPAAAPTPAAAQSRPAPAPAKAPEPAPRAPEAPAKPAPARAAVPAEGKSAAAPELKGEVHENKAMLGAQPTFSGKDPVRITSDRMTYNQAENSVVFSGNVHATHGTMALWAARVTAYFTEKAKGGKEQDKPAGPAAQDKGGNDMSDKIDRIVAEGNVRMVANKDEGACAQLTYIVAEGVIRMDGNPILREGQSTVRGDVIKFYIKENRSEVLSGAQRRVEAIFVSPKGDKK